MSPLFKTTIVIWSAYDGTSVVLSSLARQAETGDAYCSSSKSELIQDPTLDPDWDGTEFFGAGDENDAACTAETPCPARAARGGLACDH